MRSPRSPPPSRWGPASCCAVVTVSHNRFRITALTVVGVALLVVSAAILGSHYLGHGRVGATLSSASRLFWRTGRGALIAWDRPTTVTSKQRAHIQR